MPVRHASCHALNAAAQALTSECAARQASHLAVLETWLQKLSAVAAAKPSLAPKNCRLRISVGSAPDQRAWDIECAQKAEVPVKVTEVASPADEAVSVDCRVRGPVPCRCAAFDRPGTLAFRAVADTCPRLRPLRPQLSYVNASVWHAITVEGSLNGRSAMKSKQIAMEGSLRTVMSMRSLFKAAAEEARNGRGDAMVVAPGQAAFMVAVRPHAHGPTSGVPPTPARARALAVRGARGRRRGPTSGGSQRN